MKQKSFTLIELLVVIAVIGLLASIVIVNLTGTRGKANIARGLQFSQSVHHALGSEAVGVWSFDEGSGTTANDSSGYGNNGTLTNGPVWRCASTDPNYTPSGQGCSLQFDGVNDRVSISNLNYPSLWEQSFTISAWIYIPSEAVWTNGNNGNIIGRGSYQGSHGLVRSVTDNQIRTWIRHDGTTIAANATISRNTWWHVVSIWDGNVAQIYTNGEFKNSVSTTPTGVPDSTNWEIGIPLAFSNDSGNYFNGSIDEVRIYEKALETAQVEELYYAGLDNLLAKGLIDEEEYQERLALR